MSFVRKMPPVYLRESVCLAVAESDLCQGDRRCRHEGDQEILGNIL